MFSAIVYTWGVAGREVRRAYLSTNPASATMLLERGRDADEMAAMAADARMRPGIINAAARTQLTPQVQQEGGGWEPNPLQIFVAALDDPMRIETLTVEQGQWPPRPGEILIDRSSFDLLNLEVGRDVVVQAPNGEPRSLRVVFAQQTITESGMRAATGVSQPNMLRLVTDPHDENTRVAVAQAANRVLTDAGVRVLSSASVRRSEAAGAGHMLPLILIFLGLSIAMGVSRLRRAGTSTMSTNVMERTREFGVMRAIGARAGTVRRIVVGEGAFIALDRATRRHYNARSACRSGGAMRELLGAAVLVFSLCAIACDTANPAGPSELSSTVALITALRQNGATVVRGDVLPRESNPFFSTNAHVLFVNTGHVNVFEYATLAAAESDAAKVSPDGSSVGSTMITWIGPPHFYKKDRLIVVYAGSADDVLRPLEAVLGPPFARR